MPLVPEMMFHFDEDWTPPEGPAGGVYMIPSKMLIPLTALAGLWMFVW